MADKNNLLTDLGLDKAKKSYAPWEKTKPHNEFRKILSAKPGVWKYLAGFGAVAWLLGAKYQWNQMNAENELQFRKAQLSKPAIELSAEQAVNFPWNQDNINEWLYRHVIITGRPIHVRTHQIPRRHAFYDGFDYVVPLVTKENADGSNQQGILLNKGWIPHEWSHVASRWRIENARPQKFYCYVSQLTELDYKQSFFKLGNSPTAARNKWGHVYLPDMAKASGLVNTEAVSLAVLEAVEKDSPLDERNPRLWATTLNVQEDYPYPKTHAGALQLPKMPWELQHERNTWLTVAAISWSLAAYAKFLI